jgi:uncharacterized protein YlxW (UPF0749 family)
MDNPYSVTSQAPTARAAAPATPRWFWPLTVMTFILGAFIAAALKTQNIVRRDNLPSPTYSGLAQFYMENKIQDLLYQKTIGKLETENTELAKSAADRIPQTHALGELLDQAQFLGGLTPVAGPGIVITLKDSPKRPPGGLPSQLATDLTATYIIHDLDLQRVVNELRAAGAEAFAVNDQRIVTTTAIRCVGPAIQVNSVPLTPPYKIRAIGDPATLSTALALPGGIAEQLKQTDPSMIAVAKAPSLILPAYKGSTEFRYCRPVKPPDSQDTGGAATDPEKVKH